jgi:type I restriction enzyme S subunit
MEVKPSYKLTEVGRIPSDWEIKFVSELVSTGPKNGYSGRSGKDSRGTLTLSLAATSSGRLVLNADTVKRLDEAIDPRSDLFLYPGDVLVQRSNTLDLVGTAAVFDGPPGVYVYPDLMMRMRFHDDAAAHFFWRYANSSNGRRFFASVAAGSSGSMPKISGGKLRQMPLPSPPRSEKSAIAAALSDVDALLDGLDRLIAKKRNLKQAAMQQLLTGQTRLPGFHGEWEVKRIADIASPASEKNVSGEKLPVLTCSKHYGFMDSLGFFKNQVFSKNLSTYKVIRRNEIGYPANHVEEGSIGLQDRYDVALVSPIYVVFRVGEGINSFFLHRLLKLDSYRQRFKAATTSSVDRRGSLRWPAFSQIIVELPPSKTEQIAVVNILSDMEAELSALEARRDKTHALKQAMMQELLTGKTRLVPTGDTSCLNSPVPNAARRTA